MFLCLKIKYLLLCYYVFKRYYVLLFCYYVFNHYFVLLVNLKRYSVGYVETTKSKIRYDERTE